MSARRLLRRLRAAGLQLEVDGPDLVVRPAADVSEWVADLIRDRKKDLLELLESGVEFEKCPECIEDDCEVVLPLGGVRCPGCRDALDAPTCASCGAVVPTPRLSAVCSLCSLDAAGLAGAEPDPPPREDPEPGTCEVCGTTEVGPSATICGLCRRRRREERER